MGVDYSVRVLKDGLVFSAAHFITFAGGQCERLHGHNYRVEVEVKGPLDQNQYVVDFIALRDYSLAIALELDHRMLLPDRNPLIRVEQGNQETTVTFEDRRWVFPSNECVVLPLANTTAELLATWFGDRLLKKFAVAGMSGLQTLIVRVEENFGQWASCERTLAS